MNIKRRIWSLPTTAIVIFCIGLAVCVYFSTLSINAINRNSSVDFPALDKIKTFSIDVERLAKDLADSAGDADKKRFASVQIKANQMLSELKSLGELEGQRAIATRLHKEFDDYYQPSSMVVKIMLGMNDSDAAPLIAKMRSAIKVLQDDLSQAQARSQAQFDGGVEICKRNVQRVLDTIIAVAVAVIAILLGSSFFVVRGIWLQLGGEPEYTRDIAVSIAAGDLSMHINTANSDSGSLLTALNEMKTRLEQMITGVIISAQTIKIASSEIASGNSDLSTRTEEQANSLQRTASSMHGIENTVNQNAENASIATQYADAASQVAIKGGQVVCQVIETMSEINSSSKKIVDIISVIDGIAFQTNILALNAAVEAARAGEQGRGFAVVAAEVRNLAQRSAGAAKEITALISDSVNKVNHGSVLVDRAGKTMDEIVESVRRVSNIMKEISSASQDQSTSIHEIDSVISHMDEMTQQNSAMVEQAAAAAASMQAEAGNLMTALEVFKLSVPESIKHRSAMPLLAS